MFENDTLAQVIFEAVKLLVFNDVIHAFDVVMLLLDILVSEQLEKLTFEAIK